MVLRTRAGEGLRDSSGCGQVDGPSHQRRFISMRVDPNEAPRGVNPRAFAWPCVEPSTSSSHDRAGGARVVARCRGRASRSIRLTSGSLVHRPCKVRHGAWPERNGLRLYPHAMSRFSAWSLLAVFGIGVFLAGLELMITATALPSILLDLAITDQLGEPAFSELRHASWIVNGYLLAYVVAMPLAGRLADVWGARRLFLGALVVFIIGSLVAGRGQSIDELILGRIIQGIGGGVLVPVGTAAASHLFEGHDRPRALGIIGALTFLGHGGGSVPRRGDPRRLRRRGRPRPARRRGSERDPRRAHPDLALGLLRQRPDRDRRAARRLGGVERLGDAASAGRPGRRRRRRLERRPRGGPRRDDADRRRRPRRPGSAPGRDRARRDRGRRDPRDGRPRAPPAGSVPRSAPVPERRLLVGGARLGPDRLRLRDRDHRRRGVRRPRPLRRPGRPAPGPRRAGRRDGARRAPVGLRRPGPVAPDRHAGRAPALCRDAVADVAVDPGDDDRDRRPRAGRVRPRLRADRDAAQHGRRRERRAGVVRDGERDRDRRPDDRHGDRRRDPDGVRLDDDRPPLRPALLGGQPGRLEGRDPGRAARPAAARRPRRRRPRGVGGARGVVDPRRHVPRRRRRDDHRDPAGPRPRRADA